MEAKTRIKRPAKVRRKQEQFKTMNVGTKKRWSQSQQSAIDGVLPSWHKYAIEDHGNIDGRDARFLKRKKELANSLLTSPAFATLPDGVSN